MKLNVLLWFVALLGLVLPRSADSRPSVAPASPRLLLLPRPLLLRLWEEFSLRLGGGGAAPDLPPSSSSSSVTRALPQQHRELEERVEKEKRSDEPPISLDLTFHLLREVLEMARAEQIAQQADSNRKLMDDFGK
ncbi:corticoliberin-like [Anabas testudineus]|uniref:Corticotropin-releasing factor domain-containing protein n=1 Tax=Anabas testudineus TaxID=64144 RepID=A0A3Q1ISK0_ANATE|nr:corticoliberin-like [Anabas testudineus]XP_026219023.1 corticoliberin-like [Anabas testudineus]